MLHYMHMYVQCVGGRTTATCIKTQTQAAVAERVTPTSHAHTVQIGTPSTRGDAWPLTARGNAWSLAATGALCMVTRGNRCTMHGHSQQEVMCGHSRQQVHYTCSIGRHTHKTTVDAGVTDDSHSAYSSRVTGVGRAGDCACDIHMTTK